MERFAHLNSVPTAGSVPLPQNRASDETIHREARLLRAVIKIMEADMSYQVTTAVTVYSASDAGNEATTAFSAMIANPTETWIVAPDVALAEWLPQLEAAQASGRPVHLYVLHDGSDSFDHTVFQALVDAGAEVVVGSAVREGGDEYLNHTEGAVTADGKCWLGAIPSVAQPTLGAAVAFSSGDYLQTFKAQFTSLRDAAHSAEPDAQLVITPVEAAPVDPNAPPVDPNAPVEPVVVPVVVAGSLDSHALTPAEAAFGSGTAPVAPDASFGSPAAVQQQVVANVAAQTAAETATVTAVPVVTQQPVVATDPAVPVVDTTEVVDPNTGAVLDPTTPSWFVPDEKAEEEAEKSHEEPPPLPA